MNHWVQGKLFAIGLSGFLSMGMSVYAAEHGGQEHGGTTTAPAAKEHGGAAQPSASKPVDVAPSAQRIRQTIRTYVQGAAHPTGVFAIKDPVTGTTRQLEFVRVHDRVWKTGSLYYSCTDMRDKQTGELLDLDFDVKATGENLKVVGARIHKVAGKARYTYDEHDNRIPVSSTSSESTPGQERAYY